MQHLDLTDYGFPGKIFVYHGEIERESKQGNKLLFLFKEKHEKEPIIRPNVQNALNLIDQQVIGCVGVEEHPFAYAGKTADEMGDLYQRALAQFGSEDGILTALGPKYFGRAVKLLRVTANVGCVEDGGLYDIAHKKDDEYREKAERLEGAYFKEMAMEKHGSDWNVILSVAQKSEHLRR